jgi:hypothetical protein
MNEHLKKQVVNIELVFAETMADRDFEGFKPTGRPRGDRPYGFISVCLSKSGDHIRRDDFMSLRWPPLRSHLLCPP